MFPPASRAEPSLCQGRVDLSQLGPSLESGTRQEVVRPASPAASAPAIVAGVRYKRSKGGPKLNPKRPCSEPVAGASTESGKPLGGSTEFLPPQVKVQESSSSSEDSWNHLLNPGRNDLTERMHRSTRNLVSNTWVEDEVEADRVNFIQPPGKSACQSATACLHVPHPACHPPTSPLPIFSI